MPHPSINSQCEEEVAAAFWALHQKQLYWKGDLPQDKIDKLEATEGWSWGPFKDETWLMLGFGGVHLGGLNN